VKKIIKMVICISVYAFCIHAADTRDPRLLEGLPPEVFAGPVGQYLTQKDIGQVARISNAGRDLAQVAMRKLDFSFTRSIEEINAALARYAGPQLQELDLSRPYITKGNLSGLRWDLLEKCTGLKVLFLRNCGLTQLPKQLAALTGLKELRLSHNIFSGVDVNWDVLPKTLEVLILSDSGLTQIPAALGSLKNLNYLGLANNKIVADFDIVNQLPQLNDINLAGNDLALRPAEIALRIKVLPFDIQR